MLNDGIKPGVPHFGMGVVKILRRAAHTILGTPVSGSSDALLLVRVAAYLQLTCAILVAAWLAMPRVGTSDRLGMAASAMLAVISALALLRRRCPARLSLRQGSLALGMTSLVIAAVTFFGGETATPFGLLYAVAAAAAAWFLSARQTAVQIGWMSGTYALAVWLARNPGGPAWPQPSRGDLAIALVGIGALCAEVVLIRMFKRNVIERDQRLATIVESSQDAVTGQNRDGVINVWNPGAERLYGYATSEAIGQPVSLVVPSWRGGEDREILTRVLAGEHIAPYRTERVRKDGSLVAVSVSVSPIYDTSARVIGASSIARDVTTLMRAEEQIAMQAELLNEVDAAVILTDAQAVVRYWSRGAQQLYGYTAEEALGRSVVDLIVPEGDRAAEIALTAAALAGRPAEGEFDAHDQQGRVFPVYVRLRGTSLGDEGVTGVIGVSLDITARREAEHAIRRRAEGEAQIANLGRLALRGALLQELFEHAASAGARVLSADGASLVEHLPEDRGFVVRAAEGWPDDHSGELVAGPGRSMYREAMRSREPVMVPDWDQERRLERSDALLSFGVRSSVGVLVGDPASPFGVLAVHYTRPHAVPADCLPFLNALANALSEAIRNRDANEAIRHQALHDELTGLPNRTLFVDRVAHALARSERSLQPLAVFLIDIDRFKLVNDSLGHAAGDELLRLLARRFAGAIREIDTLARIGGDEFAVLCEELPSETSVTRIAERLMSSLEQPVAVGGEEHAVSASVGVATSSNDSTAADLLRDADAALNHAKAAGPSQTELFDTDMRDRILGRVRTEAALRHALTDDQQLYLDYQPLVSLSSGQIVGAEALARWRHPEWGPVSPLEFIEVAEDSGLIHELGALVVRLAARESAAWQHHRGFSGVAVNVSTRQLIAPDEVPALITAASAAAGLAPGALTVEITESRLIENLDTTRTALSALKGLGVRLSLDDFGTGYSSLSYLRDLPLDSVKIDRSLIANIIETPKVADLAAAIVDMAHALDLQVIAEGVETGQQAALLQALGCDIAQGYYFAKPMAPEQLTALLHRQPDWLPGSSRYSATEQGQEGRVRAARRVSGIWMLDERELTTYADLAVAAIIGCEPEQMLGRPLHDFLDGALDAQESNKLVIDGAVADGPREVRLRGPGGRRVWAEVSASPLPRSAGEYAGSLLLVTDITDRKTAEANIVQLAALVESAGESIITLTPTGEIATWNQAAQRLYGYTYSEAIGQHGPTLLASDAAARGRLLDTVARGEIAQVECRDVRKDGNPVDVSVTDSPIRNAEGHVVAIARVARDNTERKAAEAESARLAAIVESSADAIISLNTDGMIETWNNGAERLYGYGAAEAIGQHAPTLLSRELGDREQLVNHGTSHGLRDMEVTDFAKDGTPVEVSGTSSPIRDSDGNTTGVSLILRDISDRRRLDAERHRIEHELRTSQKLQAVGGLAAGIAHEINTPVQYIGDSARFLRDAVGDLDQLIDQYRTIIDAGDMDLTEFGERARAAEDAADLEYLRERVPAAFARLLDGVKRVASMVRAMKAFSHTTDSQQQAPADLNQAIQTTLEVARNEYKYVAEVETSLGDLPPVTCTVGELEQVLLNLITNAAHAIEDATGDNGQLGTITIATEANAGDAIISVADTGCGIPDELRTRVFDPFFTTKEAGRGTGQGLALAQEIIARHAGSITFDSDLGHGSIFTVKIPLGGHETTADLSVDQAAS